MMWSSAIIAKVLLTDLSCSATAKSQPVVIVGATILVSPIPVIVDRRLPSPLYAHSHLVVCSVEDPATKRHRPRNYVEQLEERVRLLELQLHEANSQSSTACEPSASQSSTLTEPDLEHTKEGYTGDCEDDLASMVGTLSLNAAGAEPTYLGPSSTFAFTRFV